MGWWMEGEGAWASVLVASGLGPISLLKPEEVNILGRFTKVGYVHYSTIGPIPPKNILQRVRKVCVVG